MKKLLLIALLIMGCASINKIDYQQNKNKFIVETEAVFQNGIIIESREYYENGNIEEEMFFTDGTITMMKEYYENGKLEEQYNLKNRTYVEYNEDETITIRPLKTFPIIKDLVTDVSWNYEQNKKIAPFKPRKRDNDGNHRFMQRDVDRIQEFRKCIECYLCQNVCHVLRDNN